MNRTQDMPRTLADLRLKLSKVNGWTASPRSLPWEGGGRKDGAKEQEYVSQVCLRQRKSMQQCSPHATGHLHHNLIKPSFLAQHRLYALMRSIQTPAAVVLPYPGSRKVAARSHGRSKQAATSRIKLLLAGADRLCTLLFHVEDSCPVEW